MTANVLPTEIEQHIRQYIFKEDGTHTPLALAFYHANDTRYEDENAENKVYSHIYNQFADIYDNKPEDEKDEFTKEYVELFMFVFANKHGYIRQTDVLDGEAERYVFDSLLGVWIKTK